MRKVTLALLFFCSGIILAQSPTQDQAHTQLASTSAAQEPASAPSSPAESRRSYFSGDRFFGERTKDLHENPVASFTAGYIYTFTDSQVGNNRSLMGWSAMPEVRLAKYFDLQADFDGLYVRSIYPSENRFIAAAGPRYTFAPRARFTPFVYAEGGEVRLTSQASHDSDWNPLVKGGIGLEHKITSGIAFQLIPGEYTGQQLDNHSWEHSYSARAGITFNLYR